MLARSGFQTFSLRKLSDLYFLSCGVAYLRRHRPNISDFFGL